MICCYWAVFIDLGVSLKWWVSPISTPSADHFELENLWSSWGNPPFFRSCPHIYITYHTNILTTTTITTITLTYLTLLYLTVHGITYTLVCSPSQQQWKPKNPTAICSLSRGPTAGARPLIPGGEVEFFAGGFLATKTGSDSVKSYWKANSTSKDIKARWWQLK